MASGLKPQTDAGTTAVNVAPSQIEASAQENQTTKTVSATATATTQTVTDGEDLDTPNNIQETVAEYFKDIPVMQDIAYCESRDRQYNTDGTVFRGAKDPNDVGVMQIDTYYQLENAETIGLDIFTTSGNMEYARDLFEKEGTKPWDSSSKCWIPRSNIVAMN